MPENDDFDPEDFVDATPRMATVPRSDIRRWQKAAKERDEALARLAKVQRETAFYRAGIPDNPLGRLFIQGYDGEVDDPDVIRAKAVEYGILSQDAPNRLATQQSLSGHTQAAQLQSGAAPGTPDSNMNNRLRAAKSSEEVTQIMNEYMAQSGVTMQELQTAQTAPGPRVAGGAY